MINNVYECNICGAYYCKTVECCGSEMKIIGTEENGVIIFFNESNEVPVALEGNIDEE